MRLAMRLPPKKGDNGGASTADPRDGESAEIIDLASRSAFPAVTERKSGGDGLQLAAGFVVVAALGAVTLWSMNAAQVAEPEPIGNPQVSPPQTAAPAPATAPVPVEPAPRRPDPAPAPIIARTPENQNATSANPYATPTMVYDASVAASRAVAAPPAAAGTTEAGAGQSAFSAGTAQAFASSIGGVGGAPVQAQAMTNPSTTVTQGTLIPAILETAINTDVPGYVRAVVSQDVRSFDGTTVLVPRSSRLIGQYQAGVQQGQKRAYVIWTRLIRPDGASVNLASPAVAFDGTTGLEGKVNSHFFKRFGSAFLLSAIGGLGAIASGGTSVFLGGAQTAVPDADISPTIRVKMGEPIRVFTSRDLDFSTVAN